MEFTGNIQFADESSWLTLTTESDDTVTISVRLNTFVPNQEAMSFEVTPNSGIVRLPAGEILRVLKGNGVGMITGVFSATQGTSYCSYSFSVLPCRMFAYKSLAATIFTTRPEKSPVYVGAEDRLWFYRMAGDVSTYVRFNYLAGGSSSNYELSPTYSFNLKYYDLDISADTMLAIASAKGLDVPNIVSYDVWIECSGSKSTVYSFVIKRMRLPLKTYKFLGRRGTYEYIHATGNFSRSIESETQVFVTSGIEQELENDYSKTFEQNSGLIESVGMNGYWLDFLAAKKRYIIEKDGEGRAIVVDEFKTSLTDRTVSSMTFKWHYANPNNTVIDKVDIDITGLGILGPSTVNDVSNTAQFQVTYSPSNTTQRGIIWSVVSGSDYASIDEKGMLTVKGGANGSTVKVRATSKDNSSVYAEKSVTVTYKIASVSVTGVSLSKSVLSLAVGESETLVATVVPERATDRSVTWESSKKNVATVNQNGTVKAVAAGSAVIRVRTNDGGFTARCNLTVAAVVNEYTLTVNCATPGATVKVLEYVAGQSSIADAVTYTGPMTFRANTTVKVWAYKNGMIGSGMQTIVMDSNKTATVACKTIPTWNLAAESSADSGGVGLPYTVSDPDSVGWRLVSDVDWISVDSDVVIYVNPNTSSDSRTGHVKLICDAVETDYAAATCEITQSAVAETPKADPFWNLPTTWTINADGSNDPSIQVTDNDNVGWKVEYPDWMEAEGGIDSGTGSGTVSFQIVANTGAERSGNITLKSAGGNTTYAVCSVSQKAAAPQEPSITFSMNSATVKATLTVLTNPMSYQNLTGLNATVSGGLSAAAASIESSSVKVTFAQNTTASERVGTVTVTGTRTDGKGTYSKSFTIVQAAARAATWSLPATQAFEAGGDGAIFTITDKDSAGWRLTLPDWCFVSDGITEGSGDRDTDLVARANDTGSSRTGTVQLVSTDGNTVYATCTVTQESKTLPSWDVPSTFRFDSLGQSESSPAGLEFTLNNPDNLGWTIDGPSYVTFTYSEDGTSKTANLPFSRGERNITPMYIHPDVNGTAERTFDLSLLTSSGAVIATCECTQDASESGATWDLPSSLTFEGGGDGAIFTITDKDSAGWRLTLPDWCFVSDGITEGSGDRDTDLVARANDTGSSRTGTVQLVSTDGNTVYATCTVTQEADNSMNFATALTLDPSEERKPRTQALDINEYELRIQRKKRHFPCRQGE